MKLLLALAAVGVLFLLGLLGAAGAAGAAIFGIVLPYLAAAVLLGGLAWRVFRWWRVPVPFHIPTTCGQQESLAWIRPAKLDNPSTTMGVAGRMTLEVLCFRSLLRNTRTRLNKGRGAAGRLVHGTSLGLWLGALAFHWSLLMVLARHLRLFTSPVPSAVAMLEKTDGFLDVGMPVYYVSSVVFLAAVTFLLVRRLVDPQLRYISLAEDYFLVVLLLAIGLSGFCLRHDAKTDLVAVKSLTMGLVSFRPAVSGAIGPLFFGHLFLVCVLAAYIPFSKVVHLAGVFLSPTRNLANNSRRVRHVNPWRHAVKVHTYEEYENDLRDKMKGAGIPVERD